MQAICERFGICVNERYLFLYKSSKITTEKPPSCGFSMSVLL
ncbi:hypothetical protein CLOSTMETH_01938 [[Clostridium] methylpentosum DSM 5476]|uniref:Uncharacterized protein n=1 Tax=[Clostridium] methylpentosum DSM 5476 TaxID=537013 RepID=C0EDL0_9FIRM|nr:hypothetical protein CLOSTMETH_01938 [[Clostridium] methylpentosum DSM 5476]